MHLCDGNLRERQSKLFLIYKRLLQRGKEQIVSVGLEMFSVEHSKEELLDSNVFTNKSFY